MRLDPAEIPELPFPAGLFDMSGSLVASTPEWRGALPGSVSFYTGAGHLVVGAATPTAPELEALMGELLRAVREALPAMDHAAALRTAVLLAGLELVSGRPLDERDVGTTSNVLEYAAASIRTRAPSLGVEIQPEERPRTVPTPATIALALVQFATNASTHEFSDAASTRRVDAIRLRVAGGPSFYVEWRTESPAGVAVRTSRHEQRRERWGWGYVRMAADALGGAALPPGLTGDGMEGACFSIGSRMLTVPLACYDGGRLRRRTQSWEQETVHAAAEARPAIAAELSEVLHEAEAEPGAIVSTDVFCARRSGQRTWAALPPEAGSHRVRDVLRALDHERALWAAPEPHATRVHALTVVLARAAGDDWPTFDPSTWAALFPVACAAMGVQAPDVAGAAVYPDPRVAAYLLAELGGELSVADDVVVYRPPAAGAPKPVLAVLQPFRSGLYALTPALDSLFR
ncbi:MAG TPA: hypothetical protein VIC57_07665 [Candidatus Dormibacteraeota bacterium]|jgi:hypothetical protein